MLYSRIKHKCIKLFSSFLGLQIKDLKAQEFRDQRIKKFVEQEKIEISFDSNSHIS